MYESPPSQPVWYKVGIIWRFLSSHLWSVWNEHMLSLTVNTRCMKHQALGEIRSNWTKTIPEGRKCVFTSTMQCSCWEENTSRSRNAVRYRSGWNLHSADGSHIFSANFFEKSAQWFQQWNVLNRVLQVVGKIFN